MYRFRVLQVGASFCYWSGGSSRNVWTHHPRKLTVFLKTNSVLCLYMCIYIYTWILLILNAKWTRTRAQATQQMLQANTLSPISPQYCCLLRLRAAVQHCILRWVLGLWGDTSCYVCRPHVKPDAKLEECSSKILTHITYIHTHTQSPYKRHIINPYKTWSLPLGSGCRQNWPSRSLRSAAGPVLWTGEVEFFFPLRGLFHCMRSEARFGQARFAWGRVSALTLGQFRRGIEFRVPGVGFRAWGFEFRDEGLGFRGDEGF